MPLKPSNMTVPVLLTKTYLTVPLLLSVTVTNMMYLISPYFYLYNFAEDLLLVHQVTRGTIDYLTPLY